MTGPWQYTVQGEEVVPPSPGKGAGRVNPYRGYDQHGVASPDVWQDVQAPDTATAHVTPYNEPVEQEPVPVRIVTVDPKAQPTERKDTRFHWELVDNVKPVRILTQDDRRTRAKIKVNEGAGVRVWLYNSESVSTWTGYPLDGTQEFETFTQGDLWCIADAPPDPRKVVVYEEIVLKLAQDR